MNWQTVKDAVAKASTVKELEKELKEQGVENPVEFLRSASTAYAASKLYRAQRQKGIKELRAELAELKAQVAKA